METKGIKNYPSFYRTFLFPFIRRRISLVTGLDRLPQHGPYIIAANHVGSFDPPMIVATVNQRIKQIVFFVTEQYVIKIFGLQRAVEKLGMIPKIDAKKDAASEYSLTACEMTVPCCPEAAPVSPV